MPSNSQPLSQFWEGSRCATGRSLPSSPIPTASHQEHGNTHQKTPLSQYLGEGPGVRVSPFTASTR